MQSVSKIIKKLLIDEPYYGLFALGFNKVFSEQVTYMGIGLEGINLRLYINKSKWDSLSENERLGLVKHNLLHICFFHVTDPTLFGAEDKHILALAQDCEVYGYMNQYVCPDNSAEKIFQMFPFLSTCQGTRYYIDFLERVQATTNNIIDGVEFNRNLFDDILNHAGHEWNEIQNDFLPLIRNQIEFQLVETANNVTYTQRPYELRETLDKLFTFKKPVFNWKQHFRRFLATSVDTLPRKTRRKESNRFEGSPGFKLGKKHKILVAIDTSGSIGKREFDEFFSEIYHIWKTNSIVDIIEWDTEVQNFFHYKGKVPSKIDGRGGTNPNCAIQFCNEHRKEYTLCIIFTDGEFYSSSLLKPLVRLMWVITSNGNQDNKYPGYTVKIPKIVE